MDNYFDRSIKLTRAEELKRLEATMNQIYGSVDRQFLADVPLDRELTTHRNPQQEEQPR